MAAKVRTKNTTKAARQAVIVLGMHRSGTSAVSGVLVRLGVRAPRSLMRPTPDNPKGYWESTAIMRFHDRILESAGTRWDDWDNFNPEWIESPEGEEFLTRLSSLLTDEYEGARLILLKDPRMCRMFSLWGTALKALDITPKVIVPLRSPAEVAKSLESRDQIPANVAKLLWLRHLLDAEYSTRTMARAFVRYSDLLDDWQCEMGRVSDHLNVKWPRRSAAGKAEIDDYLAPELRHHSAIDHTLSVNSAIDRWAADSYRAMASFIADPHLEESLQALDTIRLEFNRTSDIYAPVFHQQRHQFERKVEKLDGETQVLSDRLEELASRHKSLQEENLRNHQMYVAEQKALAESRRDHQEREDTFVAMTSKYEFMRAEATSNAEKAQLAQATQSELVSRLETLRDSYAKIESDHRRELADTAHRLNLEIKQLKEVARLSEDSLEERFIETARLTKTVFDLEENLTAERARVDEKSSRIRVLEGESVALAKNIAELKDQLHAIRTTCDKKDATIGALETERAALAKDVSELEQQLTAERAAGEKKNSWIRGLESESAQLSQALHESRDKLTADQTAARAERARLESRLQDGAREIAERDKSIIALQATVDESSSRTRSLELEIEEQNKLIVEYRTDLERLRSGAYQKLTAAVRRMVRSGRDLPSTDDEEPDEPDEEVLRSSHLFDRNWYLERYPDVRSKGIDPIRHYLEHGAKEGRDPCAAFSTDGYVARNPDVAQSGANPLVHYLRRGRREGRPISVQPGAIEAP